LLAVEVPDDVDLDEWANVEEGAPEGWRRDWCVPADLLNDRAVVTLVDDERERITSLGARSIPVRPRGVGQGRQSRSAALAIQ
jgi:hypothetical protein